MFKDRMLIWILEYMVGGTLVLVPLVHLVFYAPDGADAYNWATQLFIVCLGVILISCASSMRQRMLLARRIDRMVEEISNNSRSPSREWRQTESQTREGP
jgi:hypothetical protein